MQKNTKNPLLHSRRGEEAYDEIVGHTWIRATYGLRRDGTYIPLEVAKEALERGGYETKVENGALFYLCPITRKTAELMEEVKRTISSKLNKNVFDQRKEGESHGEENDLEGPCSPETGRGSEGAGECTTGADGE